MITQIEAPVRLDENQLAINGGPKVRQGPPPVRKLFGIEEKQAVMDLFDDAMVKGSSVLGYNGPQETAYCKEFAEFLGGGYADGVNSGTNAVFVALRALELEPFSEVITSPISDAGGVMPVALCNLIPVPADSEPGQYNTSAAQIERRITPRTRAILITHIMGNPVDMEPVMALANKHGLYVIEDCAQAHGSVIRGRKAGTFGHVAAFSTMFGKQHSSGGQGGMVFTTDEQMYWRVRRHADRGKPFGITLGGGAGDGVGGASGGGANAVAALNCNMDELHASIGRVQLRKLPAMLSRRRAIARRIIEGCTDFAGITPTDDPPHGECTFWFLFFKFDDAAYRISKKEFAKALAAEGLPFEDNYAYFPSRMLWAQKQQVFGSSQLPWTGGSVEADHPKTYSLDNALAADATHFRMLFHEGWSDADAAQALEILAKVDEVYRR